MEASKRQDSKERTKKKHLSKKKTLQDKRLVIQIGSNCIYPMFSSTAVPVSFAFSSLFSLTLFFISIGQIIKSKLCYFVSNFNGTKLPCRRIHLLVTIFLLGGFLVIFNCSRFWPRYFIYKIIRTIHKEFVF